MPVEREGYRDNLARIVEKFPHKEMLTKKDVANLTGLDQRTVSKHFPFRNNYISVAILARHMCS